MTLQQRINWQISEMRGWKKVDAGFGCTSLIDPSGAIVETSRHEEQIQAAQIDWHADANWPALFRELPKGCILLQRKETGAPPWSLCACSCEGSVRICENADTIGSLICKVWIAVTIGKAIVPEFEDLKKMFSRPSINSVN